MNRNLKPLLAFCILHSAFCIAGVPLRFAADAESPRTFQASAYRGETLDIEARLTLRGAPLAVADGSVAAMCWQTNGMGDAWWTAPASVTTGGVVTATWSPSNDVGAASYRVFLRVAGTGGASYRANMLLRMLGSPGETPNALPLPVPVLDFAKIVVTNEPWSTSVSLTTNDVRAIVEADAPVKSVNGKAGAVSLGAEDVNALPTDALSVEFLATDSGFAHNGNTLLLPDDSGTLALREDIASATNGLARSADLGTAAYKDASEFATATNLPPISATATVGDLVDAVNAIANALRKEEP